MFDYNDTDSVVVDSGGSLVSSLKVLHTHTERKVFVAFVFMRVGLNSKFRSSTNT